LFKATLQKVCAETGSARESPHYGCDFRRDITALAGGNKLNRLASLFLFMLAAKLRKDRVQNPQWLEVLEIARQDCRLMLPRSRSDDDVGEPRRLTEAPARSAKAPAIRAAGVSKTKIRSP
jgi:hypothetical protein